MTPRLRWALWATLLAAAVALVAGDQRGTNTARVVEAVPRATPVPEKAGPSRVTESRNEPMIDEIRPRKAPAEPANAFTARDWRPPPPPPAAAPPGPVAAPAPVAPPLPFKVLGKKLEDGQWQVFLADATMVHVVRAQDTVDARYRVVEIRPPTMTLLYVPLGQRQVLQIGGAD